jgi:1,4-alpha-glucan branching enzyme
MRKGYLSIVLHSHLPFVKHPEEEYFLEENWLNEAITETYLPLYVAFDKLRREGVRFQITMSITPPLANMLTDDLLKVRYARYLNSRIELVKHKLKGVKNKREIDILEFYLRRFLKLKNVFENDLGFDILSGFKELQEEGFLEIITCSATHEILPLELNKRAREVQIEMGVSEYKRIFSKNPRGIWLGECAYTKGIDKILSDNGILFTFVDTHGILYADPSPAYGVHSPIISNNGVAFFGRDPDASKQVWSAQEGYPGDFNYREFYRDIGYELSEKEVRKYLHPAGFRFDSGIKMHKITGKVPLGKKELYNRKMALQMAETHAGNFMFNREKEVEYLLSVMDREPIIIAPFDTELFGHWWFEGPDFLEQLLRKIYMYSDKIETITPYHYLEKYPVNQVSNPAPSTWGDGGYFKVWLNERTDWIYSHLHVLGKKMIRAAEKFEMPASLEKRVLNQMARELLLAQSSDWAFLITVGTAVSYATQMEEFHINAFMQLLEMLNNGDINESLLAYLENKDSIFPFIDYSVYRKKE